MDELHQYGIVGLIVIALVTWILKMDKDAKKKDDRFNTVIEEIICKHENALTKISDRHDEAYRDITNTMNQRQDVTNQIIREHTGILQALKALLESGFRKL